MSFFAVLVFLQIGFITAGAVGDMGLFITTHYREQRCISVPTHCGVPCESFKFFFLAYLTSLCSKMSLFYIDFQTQHRAVVFIHFMGIYCRLL